jgi:hypothetical protein
MQFLYLGKAAEAATHLLEKHNIYSILHEAFLWPVGGGFTVGVQILTIGEGWSSILPQLIDMYNGLGFWACPGPDGLPTPSIKI